MVTIVFVRSLSPNCCPWIDSCLLVHGPRVLFHFPCLFIVQLPTRPSLSTYSVNLFQDTFVWPWTSLGSSQLTPEKWSNIELLGKLWSSQPLSSQDALGSFCNEPPHRASRLTERAVAGRCSWRDRWFHRECSLFTWAMDVCPLVLR